MTTSASDYAGNNEAFFNARGSTFTFDNFAPTAYLVSPVLTAVNSLALITGTAGDDVSGISIVQMAMHDETQAQSTGWWDGVSGFGASQASQFISVSTGQTGVLTSTWSYASAALVSALTSGRTYTLLAQASDNAGNQQSTYGIGVSSLEFIYDTQRPTSLIQLPLGGRTTRRWARSLARPRTRRVLLGRAASTR